MMDLLPTITVRRMGFEYPPDLDPVFIQGEPEESYLFAALSLLLPYLEPYLIRTMKDARNRITDPALLRDLDKFIAQEGQHYTQHARFNALFRDRVDGIADLERTMNAEYRRFSSSRSLRFNLAYSEAFEALATAVACAYADQDHSKWHPAAEDLFGWHLVEELEHRAVVFDVYQQLCGDYLYRVKVAQFAHRHLLGFARRAMMHLLDADPRCETTFGGAAGRRRRMRRLVGVMLREVLPRALKSYSPRYSPRDLPITPSVAALKSRADELAVKSS
jgi:predicted metal-dependent hydrolase